MIELVSNKTNTNVYYYQNDCDYHFGFAWLLCIRCISETINCCRFLTPLLPPTKISVVLVKMPSEISGLFPLTNKTNDVDTSVTIREIVEVLYWILITRDRIYEWTKAGKNNNNDDEYKVNGTEFWSGHALYFPSNCAAKEKQILNRHLNIYYYSDKTPSRHLGHLVMIAWETVGFGKAAPGKQEG